MKPKEISKIVFNTLEGRYYLSNSFNHSVEKGEKVYLVTIWVVLPRQLFNMESGKPQMQ